MSTVTFLWQQNGLQSLSIQRVKSEFPSFKNCYLLLLLIQWVWVNIWTFHSRSTRKSVSNKKKLWSNKWSIFHFGKVEVWWRVCCCGDIITNITMCSFCNTSTLQNFNPALQNFIPVDLLFYILLFHIILCPHCDITNPVICINQNREYLTTKNANNYNKINDII